MSKKRNKNTKLAYKQQIQKAARPGARLAAAREALKHGDLAQALTLAADARRTASDPDSTQQARTLVAEVHFRLAAATQDANQRLQHLDAALVEAPEQGRLHYHRGLTLWRMAKVRDATAAFEQAAKLEPNRSGLPFLRQLCRLAVGEPAATEGLSPAEANTIQFLHAVRERRNGQLPSLSQPVLGDSSLWTALVEMMASANAAPPLLLPASPSNGVLAPTNPIVRYYQGVAALRKGDFAAAQEAWSSARHGLARPWHVDNLTNLNRDQAAQLAQQGRWEEVATLYHSTIAGQAVSSIDNVFSEAAGLAFFHLGYQAAQKEEWEPANEHWQLAALLTPGRQLAQNLALAAEARGDWFEAAEAWREMIRRRPRKASHPDYLSDGQVAAIWRHIANCYLQVDEIEEMITCLKTAIKYAPEDLELRINLVDALHSEDRVEAAENELDRILEVNADHVPALVRQALLYTGRWDRDPKPVWERVLDLEPGNADAKQALAMIYLGMATGDNSLYSWRGNWNVLTSQAGLKILQTGLERLPGDPLLLQGLGTLYQRLNQNDQARTSYRAALEAALTAKNIKLIDISLHELLHVEGGDVVKELLPRVSSFPNLRANFWVDQGRQAMECEFGQEWAEFFWNEAVRMAERNRTMDSLVTTLVQIHDSALAQELPAVAQQYEKRLRTDHRTSGAIEYIEAVRLHTNDPERKGPVLALVRKAKAAANKAGERELAELIDAFDEFVRRPAMFNPFSMINERMLDEIFGEMGKEELDAFRRLF
jgi:tetratricopeptide (TPR) repeat protein